MSESLNFEPPSVLASSPAVSFLPMLKGKREGVRGWGSEYMCVIHCLSAACNVCA